MMRRLVGVMALSVAMILGCVGGEEVDCAEVCGQEPAPDGDGGGESMTPFEQSIVGPALADIREGIRAWDEQSVGICLREGSSRDCIEYLGESPGELPPGTYMVYAQLRVPDAGENGTWKVTINVDCTTTRTTDNGSSTFTNNYSKSYGVQYINEERGSRLSPLYKIDSPNDSGRKECTYSLEYAHPDTPSSMSGSWIVPATE